MNVQLGGQWTQKAFSHAAEEEGETQRSFRGGEEKQLSSLSFLPYLEYGLSGRERWDLNQIYLPSTRSCMFTNFKSALQQTGSEVSFDF